jgi:RNA polymerase sigma-B factor
LCTRGAKKFGRRGVDKADLEQVAAIGLIKAIETYREELQTPFEAYAWITIQGELMHHIRDHERLVRAPRSLRERERRWHAAEAKLFKKFGREPIEDEVASHLELNAREMLELREYRDRATVTSLDEISPKLSMLVSYTLESHDDRLMLESAFARLTALERQIIHATVTENYSVGEIAKRVGYSLRHVSRLRNAALRKVSVFCAATSNYRARGNKKSGRKK